MLIISIRFASPVDIKLSLIGLTGIFICYQWKWRGVWLSFGFLAAALGYYLISSQSEWLWQSVLALSIASSFVVTALALEESRNSWDALSKENEDHRQSIAFANERLHAAQNRFNVEYQEAYSRLEQRDNELKKKNDKLQASERLVELIRDEMTALHQNQERLLEELYSARQEAAALELKVESKPSFQHNENVSSNELFELRRLIAIREGEIAELKCKLEESLKSSRLVEQQIKEHVSEIASVRQFQKRENDSLAKVQSELNSQHRAFQELSDRNETLSREKRLLETTLTSLQNELEEVNCSLEEMTKKENSTSKALLEWQPIVAEYQLQKENHATLQEQLGEVVNERAQLNEYNALLQQTLNELKQNFETASSREIELQKKIDDFVVGYQELEQKQQKDQDELNSLKSFEIKFHQLAEQLLEQKKLCQKLSVENEQLQQALQNPPPAQDSEASQQIRKLQGLYFQLREQFAEKSQVLDATRRELFHTHEKLLSLQMELEEAKIYNEGEVEKSFSDLLKAAEEELKTVEKQASAEILYLEDIINAMLLVSKRDS